MLARYAARRRADRCAGIAFTHGLVQLFGSDCALAALAARVGAHAARRAAAGEARVHARDAVRPVAEARVRSRGRARSCAHRDRANVPRVANRARNVRARRGIGIIRVPSLQSPSASVPSPIVRIGPYASAEQPRRRADGGRHRSAVPRSCASGSARATRCRRWSRRIRGCATREKSRRRIDHAGEVAPIAVQIAGADPAMMADAARYNVDRGAQIIDINMGCPAKKVCNVAAGSALLAQRAAGRRDRRRGRARGRRAGHAQDPHRPRSGAPQCACASRASPRTPASQALAVHGRTRACAFVGAVEYDTIARGQGARSRIPVIANGDIDTPEQRARRAARTPAPTRVMIGRAAQGRPWIFREIAHFLATGDAPAAADGRGGARADRRAPRTTTTRSTASAAACASRASTSAGTPKDLAGGEAFRARDERGRDARRRSSPPSADSSIALAGASERLDYRTASRRDVVDARAAFAVTRRSATGRGGPRRVRKTLRINGSNEIGRSVEKSLDEYFRRLDGEPPHGIYDMVIGHVERALLASIMDARRAATRRRPPTCSGMNRNTLRTKLVKYKLRLTRAPRPIGVPRPCRPRSRKRCCPFPTRPGSSNSRAASRALGVRAAVDRRHGEGARRRGARRSPRSATTPAFPRCSTAASRRCIRRCTAASSRAATCRRTRRRCEQHGIPTIDLVVVNLYPFRETVAKPGCTLDDAIENIDIGGPTMVRAAAKNWQHVGVVVDPADYAALLAELEANGGALSDGDALRAGAEGVLAHGGLRRRDRELADGARPRRRGRGVSRPLQPAGGEGAGPALRREPAPAGGVLPRRAAGAGHDRDVPAAAGQGALVQQHRRRRRRVGVREDRSPSPRASSSSTRIPAASRSPRRRSTPTARAFATDPTVGLRRHHRVQPAGRRGDARGGRRRSSSRC